MSPYKYHVEPSRQCESFYLLKRMYLDNQNSLLRILR